MKKIVLQVPDMHCPNCVMTLEGLEDDLPGVKRVKASYHRLKMEVEFDETCLTVEQIIEATRKLGYQPQVE
ncbi:MAG TPA: heavy-metal-associated domain-containing protein [Anaerolineaceae bacterium]